MWPSQTVKEKRHKVWMSLYLGPAFLSRLEGHRERKEGERAKVTSYTDRDS
jgi:hypothetical protein